MPLAPHQPGCDPSRLVRIIVGAAPGGSQDIAARLIGQWLSERLGRQFREGSSTRQTARDDEDPMPKKEYFLKQRAIIDPDGNRAGSASNLRSALRSYVIKVNRKRNREGVLPVGLVDL